MSATAFRRHRTNCASRGAAWPIAAGQLWPGELKEAAVQTSLPEEIGSRSAVLTGEPPCPGSYLSELVEERVPNVFYLPDLRA